MSLDFKELSELYDTVSLFVNCPSEANFMLLMESSGVDFWLPCVKVQLGTTWINCDEVLQDVRSEKLHWSTNFQNFNICLPIFGSTIPINKLLSLTKIWLPHSNTKYLVHTVFEVVVNSEQKKKSRMLQSKYKNRLKWVNESELNALFQTKQLKTPELLLLYNFAYSINGNPYNPPPNYNLQANFTEIGEDIIITSKTSTLEQLVHAAGLDRRVQEVIYRDFMFKCFPTIYMSYDCFNHVMIENGWDKEEIPHIFRSADVQNRNALSFREYLFFLAVVEPGINYAGALGELRCRYIFRYLDTTKKNLLKKDDLRKLYVTLRKTKNQPIDNSKIDKELTELFKLMKLPESHSLTMAQFLTNVGELKIRGTSQIYRSPTNIRKYFLACLKTEAKNKTAKDEVDLSNEYDVATHCLTIGKTANSITVDEITTFNYALSVTTLRIEGTSITRRQKSYDQFNKKSLPNQIIDTVKELVNLNKMPIYQKIENMKYNWGKINQISFLTTLKEICVRVKEIFIKEPRLLEISSPVYILGDLHGNIIDLLHFENTLWSFGYGLCPSNLLFLGDYVDRGMFGIEVMLYLFAMKLLIPNKMHLIRGNHEIKQIQKLWTFELECNKKFGEKNGAIAFNAINEVFDVLPLAAVVDDKIFCCHGGIPPPWLCPTAIAINDIPIELNNPQEQSSLAWELMWNDPIKPHNLTENIIMEMMANEGFAVNTYRNTGHFFSAEALQKFLDSNGFTHMVRAHEMNPAGFYIQQKAKVVTIFSSSQYCNGKNEAACLLVDNGKLRAFRLGMNGSPL